MGLAPTRRSSYRLPVMKCIAFLCAVACTITAVQAHGSLVTPRPRNSIDYLAGVNEQVCANITGKACHNGQASFWYSQGCFM